MGEAGLSQRLGTVNKNPLDIRGDFCLMLLQVFNNMQTYALRQYTLPSVSLGGCSHIRYHTKHRVLHFYHQGLQWWHGYQR